MDFTLISYFVFSGIGIFSLLLIWSYSKRKKREIEVDRQEILKYTREVSEYRIQQAQETIAAMEEESRQKLYTEFEQLRENSLRSVDSEVEREYHRKIGIMKDGLDRYTQYIDSELEAEYQTWLATTVLARESKSKLESQVEDIASQLVSLTEAERSLLLEEEALRSRMIQLPEEERNDIELLMNEILPRIKRPDLVRKLVWTEYVQRPTTLLLNTILPQDCAGIYKITYLPDKKCYVGRSTSVRKRLTEHIKSSLGVGTIADQQVHHAMRKEGLHNFMFELIEECDKDALASREKFYIEKFQANKWGYNGNVGG